MGVSRVWPEVYDEMCDILEQRSRAGKRQELMREARKRFGGK